MEDKAKTDMRKKGLGWVPDYPDLRDYNLDNEDAIKHKLRFKIEENTGNIENIVEVLINLIDFLKTNNQTNLPEGNIEEIKNKIFGSVLFVKIKVHRILRDSYDEIDENENQYPLYPLEYESILSKQTLELNKYLGVLLMGGYLLPPESVKDRHPEVFQKEQCKKLESKKLEKVNVQEALKSPEGVDWVLKLMRQKNYIDDTKDLVKRFQICSQIRKDGIVGLETNITLNEYFSDYEKLEDLKECNINIEENPQYPSRIKFLSTTSLIPSTAFSIILEVLIFKATKQIYEEYKNNQEINDYKRIIYEHDFLIKIKCKEKSYFYQKEIENILKNNRKFSDDIKKIINTQLDETSTMNEINTTLIKNEGISSILNHAPEVLQNSYVIEPLISVVIKSIYPLSLSKWKKYTFKELIKKGFEEFEKFFKKANKANNYSANTEPGYTQEQLVKCAISKVLELLSLEIHSLLEEKEQLKEQNKDKYTCAVLLYFLIKKYLNHLEQLVKKDINHGEQDNNSQYHVNSEEPKPNIFDKQEVFEFERVVSYHLTASTDSQGQKKSNLFPSLDLYIPIIGKNLLKSLQEDERNDTNKQPSKKPFFLLPGVIDLSYWFSPVRDQGSLNSCTAFAAIALLEYFENRNFGKSVDASPLFLYKAARNKMSVQGDVGASIRETMKVLALIGVPPEESWRYDEDLVNEEPPPYCYAYAQNYQSLKYFLLDYAGITKESLLFQIKAVLAAGFPCIFGFTIYSSAYEKSNYRKGLIVYPDPQKDKVIGGHTVVAVGYDDYKFIQCSDRRYYSKGAFLIRNSWGSEWGVEGYGWLPYHYVLAGLTAAWWSLLKAEWFDESNFGSSGGGGEDGGAGTGG
ncbi:C1 family peptidase [Pelatocladus sp. BLCC-F211]|uniref:C1 family peptidase n=1 Tax=Pelatocladus sp. BLCC-F211 TaxID=3342752 RepID=UPI0035B6F5B0